jgi:hypothetical protein
MPRIGHVLLALGKRNLHRSFPSLVHNAKAYLVPSLSRAGEFAKLVLCRKQLVVKPQQNIVLPDSRLFGRRILEHCGHYQSHSFGEGKVFAQNLRYFLHNESRIRYLLKPRGCRMQTDRHFLSPGKMEGDGG